MLTNLLMRVHCKFATPLLERVLFWAYHWLRGKGGYLMERDGTLARPLDSTVVVFALTVYHDSSIPLSLET